jgi:hypothetical protein
MPCSSDLDCPSGSWLKIDGALTGSEDGPLSSVILCVAPLAAAM